MVSNFKSTVLLFEAQTTQPLCFSQTSTSLETSLHGMYNHTIYGIIAELLGKGSAI